MVSAGLRDRHGKGREVDRRGAWSVGNEGRYEDRQGPGVHWSEADAEEPLLDIGDFVCRGDAPWVLPDLAERNHADPLDD